MGRRRARALAFAWIEHLAVAGFCLSRLCRVSFVLLGVFVVLSSASAFVGVSFPVSVSFSWPGGSPPALLRSVPSPLSSGLPVSCSSLSLLVGWCRVAWAAGASSARLVSFSSSLSLPPSRRFLFSRSRGFSPWLVAAGRCCPLSPGLRSCLAAVSASCRG